MSDASLPVERFDLSYAGGVPGQLLVQPRRGERTLGRLDRRLIRQVADQAGAAVAAAGYIGELTLSRERLVLGREEERARLRRDLHDGLGPALAGLTLALTAARRLLRSDPDTADTLLETARDPRRARPGATYAESLTTCDRRGSRSWDWSGRLRNAAGH